MKLAKTIINEKLQDEDVIIVPNLEIASNFWQNFCGLMLRRKKNFQLGQGLLFLDCSSIHMFFMLFPIDVVFLGKDFTVVKIVKNVKPWTVAFGGNKAYRTLELPIGGADDIDVGDMLKLTK